MDRGRAWVTSRVAMLSRSDLRLGAAVASLSLSFTGGMSCVRLLVVLALAFLACPRLELREMGLVCVVELVSVVSNSLAFALLYHYYVGGGAAGGGWEGAAGPPPAYFRRHLEDFLYNCTFSGGAEGTALWVCPFPWNFGEEALQQLPYPWNSAVVLIRLSFAFNCLVLFAVVYNYAGDAPAGGAAPTEGPAATPGLTVATASSATTAGTLVAPVAAQVCARTQVLVTSTVSTQTPAEGIAAAQEMDDETHLEGPAEPVSLAPVWKRRCTNRAGHQCPSGPWQEEEPQVVTTQHLSLSELRDLGEDFGRQEGEELLRWLLRCWDNGANSLDLNGRQPKGLGLLAKDEGVDRYLWKDPRPLTLWKRLLLAMRKRYSSRDHVVYQLEKWTTIRGGIRNLRQTAVRELIFSDLDDPQTPLDPDALKVTRLMWHNWLLSGPPLHASRVAIFYLEGEEAPTVDFVKNMLQQYADSLSSSPRSSHSPVEQESHQSAELLGFQPRRLGQDPDSTDTSGSAGWMVETALCADPAEVPEEPGASAASVPTEVLRARSRVVVCGICMERVYEKQLPEERLFGILPNCSHAYCVGCIRKWRQSREFENEVIKACPECRVTSSYYIPHKYWVSDADEKEKLIKSFRARTGKIRCKFFVRSRGHCPFKSDCIYLHELPAGRLPRRRRRQPLRLPFEFSRSPLESSDEADEDLFVVEGALASMGLSFVGRGFDHELLFMDFIDSD
ncbi:uncharacterized protein [Heliangelus exortis]|uniref:uncharacterized protein isoform X1 n=1 Tax=Heliangelus exortis TaxID=472823 RepID=UPI003A90E0AF